MKLDVTDFSKFAELGEAGAAEMIELILKLDGLGVPPELTAFTFIAIGIRTLRAKLDSDGHSASPEKRAALLKKIGELWDVSHDDFVSGKHDKKSSTS